ncbi:MAG: YopX family protein [Lachnospiraceae bacterium]|nr:YopX family protein [Lachnospiraceae bacterium]
MSREILFKAQRVNGHDWVFGSHVYTEPLGCEKHYIVSVVCDAQYVYEVDPSTLCQSIGLDDCNEHGIFENDLCEVVGEDGLFLVSWDADAARFVLDGDGVTIDFDNVNSRDCEYVGNIFDSPGLLEGGTGEDG